MRQRKTLDVTEFDILAEIERLRQAAHHNKTRFTPEQDAALWSARQPGRMPVKWDLLRDVWAKKWETVPCEAAMRERLRRLVAAGGPQGVNAKTTRGG